MSARPRVALGMPTYNGSDHLREALDSLLGQRYDDFVLIIVDDASIDATPEILEHYAQRDPRIRLHINEHRVGMVGNWRRCFEYAERELGDFEYFAWVSDHDAWHPRWLKCLVAALDTDDDAVIAYPETLRRVYDKADWRPWLRPMAKFDSGTLRGLRRYHAARRNMFAGSMVYGLVRAADLRACGVFRPYLEPDRLLLLELAIRGAFRQVPEVLYYRQRFVKPTRARQRSAMFVGRVPWTARMAPAVGHAHALATSRAASRPRLVLAAATELAAAPDPRIISRTAGGWTRALARRVDLADRAPLLDVSGRLSGRLLRALTHPPPAQGNIT